MEKHGLSDDLIKRLPQRISLSEGRWKRLIQQILILSAIGLPFAGFWFFWELNPEWRGAFLIISICWAGVLYLIRQAIEHIVEPLLVARGLLPNIEYLPQDDQVILTDLSGFEALFRPEARVVFYLGSLAAVEVHEAENGNPHSWQISIRTRKSDRFPISSSTRNTREQAHAIGHSLAVMLSLPLE